MAAAKSIHSTALLIYQVYQAKEASESKAKVRQAMGCITIKATVRQLNPELVATLRTVGLRSAPKSCAPSKSTL